MIVSTTDRGTTRLEDANPTASIGARAPVGVTVLVVRGGVGVPVSARSGAWAPRVRIGDVNGEDSRPVASRACDSEVKGTSSGTPVSNGGGTRGPGSGNRSHRRIAVPVMVVACGSVRARGGGAQENEQDASGELEGVELHRVVAP